MSYDGSVVVFTTWERLVAQDSDDIYDVYLWQDGEIELISSTPSGESGNDNSWHQGISSDGSIVYFSSWATDLDSGEPESQPGLYQHNIENGNTELVGAGMGTFKFSADGTTVAFVSEASDLVEWDTNNQEDIFVYDTQENTLHVATVSSEDELSRPRNKSDRSIFTSHEMKPSIDYSGNTVTFISDAPNLVLDDLNNAPDVFVHLIDSGETHRVMTWSGQEPKLNSKLSTYWGFSRYWFGQPEVASISGNGSVVAFTSNLKGYTSDDISGTWDVFVAHANID